MNIMIRRLKMYQIDKKILILKRTKLCIKEIWIY